MTTPPRKVMVLTGKRGGFGAMKPMLRALRDAPTVELQLVVTDQHLDERFGKTIREVEAEFVVAAALETQQEDDRPRSRSIAMARCMDQMTRALERLQPEILVLYGDRGEVVAAAFAATLLGIPIAHIQGGDRSGSVDDQFRHAVTKLSHLHFPSTEQSRERIIGLGEEDWRVEAVGDCHIDLIVAGEYTAPRGIASKLELDPTRPIIVVLQHSETTAPGDSYEQMTETLLAVRESGHQAVVCYPCSDPGYEGVLQAIHEFASGPQFRVYKNLAAPDFWGLLNIATVLVGNSSAGLIETPYFGITAVNVGRRQEGRLHADNVAHVDHDRSAIGQAIARAIEDGEVRRRAKTCSKPFGNGDAGRRIAQRLSTVALSKSLLVKRMTY